MNALVPLCDSLARLLWAVSWQVALLVALLWVVSLACRRASAAFRYWLWCLVLLRLCVPFSLTFPIGVVQPAPAIHTPQSAIPNPQSSMPQSAIPIGVYSRPPHSAIDDSVIRPPQSAIRNSFSFRFSQYLILLWLAAVAGLGLLVLIQTWRVRRRVRGLTEIRRSELKALFVNLRSRMGIRRAVTLLYADAALADAGPLTLGLLRPVVVLPPRVADGWALEELAPVLLHELAHVRRRDLLVNFFQMIVQVVYFFHPLVWLANWRIRQEREWACDDLAVAQIGGRPDLYSRAFLRIIEECRGKASPGTAGLGMAERRSALGARIRRILDHRYQAARQMGKLSVLGLVLIGGLCIALASEQPARQEKTGTRPVDSRKAPLIAEIRQAFERRQASLKTLSIVTSGTVTFPKGSENSTYAHEAAMKGSHARPLAPGENIPSAEIRKPLETRLTVAGASMRLDTRDHGWSMITDEPVERRMTSIYESSIFREGRTKFLTQYDDPRHPLQPGDSPSQKGNVILRSVGYQAFLIAYHPELLCPDGRWADLSILRREPAANGGKGILVVRPQRGAITECDLDADRDYFPVRIVYGGSLATESRVEYAPDPVVGYVPSRVVNKRLPVKQFPGGPVHEYRVREARVNESVDSAVFSTVFSTVAQKVSAVWHSGRSLF